MAFARNLLAAAAAAAAVASATQPVPANNVTVQTRACQPPYDQFPFCNTTLSLDERVADLVARIMEVPSDIPPQLTARHIAPVPQDNCSRLGLPEFDYGMNAIHGVQSTCVTMPDGSVLCPSSLPNPINYGIAWNDSLSYDLGAIVGDEGRALWLLGATEASNAMHIGLDCWSPNINVARDPRWGRNQEVPSEDPLTNGNFGMQYTQGVQTGVDPRFIKLTVTLKHWDAYSLENSDGFTRYDFNAVVSNYTLADSYFPAFKAAVVQGNAKGVMCSYNAVNGIPTCAHPGLSAVLRNVWGFDGYITSDSGALENIAGNHHYTNNSNQSACVAIVDGTCDVCSGSVYLNNLLPAVAEGLCAMDDVAAALTRVFRMRMRMGLFDPIEDQPYWQVPPSVINSTAHQATNRLTTLSGQVLLKHDGVTLPLPTGKTVAVIGPHITDTAKMVGNYLGQLCPDGSWDCIQTPLAGIAAANVGGSVVNASGCVTNSTDTDGFKAALAAAQAADIIVYIGGIDQSIEGEMNDRTNIDLPAIQHQLIANLSAVATTGGKKFVCVFMNGGALDISPEDADPAIGAILWVGYPGVMGAAGIAASLFGGNDHLGGKSPVTVYYKNYTDQILMSEMEMDVPPGRGYRYFNGSVLYPLGWGLSLTTFSIRSPDALGVSSPLRFTTEPVNAALGMVERNSTAAAAAVTATVTLNVTNTGTTTGDDVVFLYMAPQDVPLQRRNSAAAAAAATGDVMPLIKQLLAYQRVHLAPGQSQIVSFNVSAASFRMVSKPSGHRVSTPGTFKLVATNGLGRWAAGARAERLPPAVRDNAEVLMDVVIEGEEHVVEPFPLSMV